MLVLEFYRLLWLLIFSACNVYTVSVKRMGPHPSAEFSTDISMPGVKPEQDEQYTCTSVEVLQSGYVVEFVPHASANRVHHMLLYGCDDPGGSPGESWNCLHGSICNSPPKIIFAWARNAPAMVLPDNVGVPVGKNVGIGYYVLQVHYSTTFTGNAFDYSGVTLHVSSQKPIFIAGIYLFVTGNAPIPANTKSFASNISCVSDVDATMHPFAFRTHTHGLGRIVSAYRLRDNEWTKIGKGNPQWPQRFYPVEKPLVLNKGDTLAAQCIFNSTHKHEMTMFGSTGHDEMCNFYMYYYVNSTEVAPKDMATGCSMGGDPDLFSRYPAEASVPFPDNAMWSEMAKQSSDRFGIFNFLLTRHRRKRGGDYSAVELIDPLDQQMDDGQQFIDFGSNGNGGGQQQQYLPVRKKPGPGIPVNGRYVWNNENTGGGGTYQNYAGGQQLTNGQQKAFSAGVVEAKNWPPADVLFGQIAGLTFDLNGNLIVFHRSGRIWNDDTFDLENKYKHRTNGPIMEDTVLTLNSNGSIIDRWGRGYFYMPHGVYMDSKGNLWVTDVALHQVLKFDPKNSKLTPLLTLGKEFQPGSDADHFCKPSGVAVDTNGLIFVSDGYCNNRIMKFDSSGKFLMYFGEASTETLPNGLSKLGTFNLPHSIKLHQSKEHVLVADRENGRVQIFDYTGQALSQVYSPMFGGAVYDVAYCEPLDLIYVLNGVTMNSVDLGVFAFDGSTKRLMFSWKPLQGSFSKPHTIAVNSDCSKVFVGEVGPNKLWRFDVTAAGRPKVNGAKTDSSLQKPETAVDDVIRIDPTSWPQLIVILSLAISVPVLLIAIVCCCVKFRKQGGFKQLNLSLQNNYRRSNGKGGKVPLLTDAFGGRSHKGFQPLRTEDIDAMDDLTDESEGEDTLYTQAPVKNGGPLKA